MYLSDLVIVKEGIGGHEKFGRMIELSESVFTAVLKVLAMR